MVGTGTPASITIYGRETGLGPLAIDVDEKLLSVDLVKVTRGPDA